MQGAAAMELVIVDTTQIQPYIFGSNRLQENIGGSFLVAQATGEWALACVPAPNNVVDAASGELNKATILEPGSNLAAEVIYAGGGNVVVLCKGSEEAGKFERDLSVKVLEEAPNLQLVIVRNPFSPGQSLSEVLQTTFEKLGTAKQQRRQSSPTWGLSVTQMCRSTTFPAVGIVKIAENDEYPASAEIHAKIEVVEKANNRLNDYLGMKGDPYYLFPYDFDNLGRTKGEESHIAVVHADGNGMGKQIQEIGYRYKTDNKGYIHALRQFSDRIKQASKEALTTTLHALTSRLKTDETKKDAIRHRNAFGDLVSEIVLTVRKDTGSKPRYYLPFRPIVFGGDDVTFVCDGRIALSLAIIYLNAFERASEKIFGEKLTSCAGIAIVKSHYPFAQAYELAEELIKKAKAYQQVEKKMEGHAGSYLDWHFALTGLSGDIEFIRKREYEVPAGWLTLRPVAVGENQLQPHRSWQVVWRGIEAFQDLQKNGRDEPDWSVRRNKMKALREMLRQGPTAVSQFLLHYNENNPLPNVYPPANDWPQQGWQNLGSDPLKQEQKPYCGYFDALELADWFIPLSLEEKTNEA